MHIDIIDNMDDLVRLKDEWEEIYSGDPESQYFLSWTWIVNWLNHIDEQWYVLAAKPQTAGDRYVAFFPIQLRTELTPTDGFFNSIRMGGWSLAAYSGFICLPEFDDRAIPALGEAIKSFNWAQFYLETLRTSKTRYALLTGCFPAGAFSIDKFERHLSDDGADYAIYPYVELPGEFETYLQTKLGSATRSNARSFLRKLDGGKFRVSHATAETFESDLDILMRFWEIKWGPLKGERALDREGADHRVMLRACFQKGEALLLVLWKDDTPIGAQGTFIDLRNRTLICLIGSRDLSFKKPSPGFLIHLHSIRWAIENGFETYDLLTGSHPYKYDFGPCERRIDRYIVSTADRRNLRGKLEPRCLPVAFDRMRMLANAGKLTEALAICRQILVIEPGHTQARQIAADLEAKLGAVPRVDISNAMTLLGSGRAAEAEKLLMGMIEAQPRSFDAHHLLGVAQMLQGRFETAEQSIATAIGINPDIAPAHYNRARALAALGRHEKALASFHRAIDLKPDNGQAYGGRGATLVQLGRLEDAIVDFDRAIGLNPEDSSARKGREDALKMLGRRP